MVLRVMGRLWPAVLAAAVLTVPGCGWRQAPVPEATTATLPFDWLVGCWLSVDGSIEERWGHSMGNAHLFGHSVTRKDGQSMFFEQLRIDLADPAPRLFAYPKGVGPTVFTAASQAAGSVVFANAANDYPQTIRYWREGTSLRAAIAQIDGSKAIEFSYVPCPTEVVTGF